MAKKAESKKAQNRVWIELERPTSPEQGKQRAELMTNMLRRLGVERHHHVWWSEHEARYCYGDAMGYIVLSDTGHWFNLDYFGRDILGGECVPPVSADIETDAADFAALQARMVDCGWGDESDGTVKHERLGMELPSWVDAISACIEVASEV